MQKVTYNWKRLWVSREGNLGFDADGFVTDPLDDPLWTRLLKTDIIQIENILAQNCLILLGEPGIGKSHAIKEAEAITRRTRIPQGARVFSRDLGCYSSDGLLAAEIFNSSEFSSWKTDGGELHIFLDSFDECRSRVDSVAALLGAKFKELESTAGLFLRIASRTAEWSAALENDLRVAFKGFDVGAYELAPLTKAQVLEAASVQLSKPADFVKAVVTCELVSFAIKPLTLDLLFRVWEEGRGELPRTQRDIYERGCLALCSDSEKRSTPRLKKRLTAEQTLAVASHIAAATFFCNRTSIWTTRGAAIAPPSHVTVAALATGSVTVNGTRLDMTESIILETLDSGLFSARSLHSLGWAHQTYGEFLAATYPRQEALTTAQVLGLIVSPIDSQSRLIPQMHEVAAWIANFIPEVFKRMLQNEPDILLRSDVVTESPDQLKAQLVDRLFDAFTNNTISGEWWTLRKRFRKLKHPRIARQVRSVVSNRISNREARLFGIDLIEACELHSLFPLLTRLALDQTENHAIRHRSALVLSRIGDTESRRRLSKVAKNPSANDSNDLHGAALRACFPEYLSTKELFRSLRPTKDDELEYTHHTFLRDELIERLPLKDIPTALCWAAAQEEYHGHEPFAILIRGIFDKAAEEIAAAPIRMALASALLTCLRKNHFSSGLADGALKKLLESDETSRRALVEEMARLFSDFKNDSLHVARWGLPLLRQTDLNWLLEKALTAKTPRAEAAYCHLVLYSFYAPDSSTAADAIILAAEKLPLLKQLMAPWLEPVNLESDSAKQVREDYLEAKRLRKRIEGRKDQAMPSTLQKITGELEVIETEKPQNWSNVFYFLSLSSDGRTLHLSLDVRGLDQWKSLPLEIKTRIVLTAENYLRKAEPKTRNWFFKKNVWSWPAMAGVQALILLAQEKPNTFDSLPREAWRKWIPAILRPHVSDDKDVHKNLFAAAFSKAPRATIFWLGKVIDLENRQNKYLFALSKLPDKLDRRLESALLAKLQKGGLDRVALVCLIDALLQRHSNRVLELLRKWLPKMPPRDGKSLDRALIACERLAQYGEPKDWPRIWRLITKNDDFGSLLMKRLADERYHEPLSVIKIVNEQQAAELWEWMLKIFPPEKDSRPRGRIIEVTPEHQLATFRDGLVNSIARGTPAGCNAIRALIKRHPDRVWLSWLLFRAEAALRQRSWQPPFVEDIFKLKQNAEARFVQSGDQLLSVLCESLSRYQDRLLGPTPTGEFLWDGDKPKPEEAISNALKIHLDDDLSGRGIVINREVQIHIVQKTDLHVTAIAIANHAEIVDQVNVIVEVKGCWNRDLKTAMAEQLVQRYFSKSDSKHGIYVVAWFPSEHWSPTDNRRRRVPFNSNSELTAILQAQAARLSSPTQTVKAIVLDVGHPRLPRKRLKGRPTSS